MRKHIAVLFFPLLLVSLATAQAADAKKEDAKKDSPNNTLSAKEKAEGWKLLFDGKDMKGWHSYNHDKDLKDGWEVVDGTIKRKDVGSAGDIVPDGDYGAFELKVDYKIGKAGNSGIMYHVVEGKDPSWYTGPEVQLQDNKDGTDPQKSGWLYQLYKADTDATKPAGQWNTVHIIISPEKSTHYMNGVKYFDYVKGNRDWDERVAKSKFAKMPNFGKPTHGAIVLQDHHSEIAFRNIKVRPLDADKKSDEKKDSVKKDSVKKGTAKETAKKVNDKK